MNRRSLANGPAGNTFLDGFQILLALLDLTQTYGRLIKFSRTIFALPFALAAVLLAHRRHPVSLWTLWWIVLAMILARSAAMGLNRYVDCELDRINPRTASRPLVAGRHRHGPVGPKSWVSNTTSGFSETNETNLKAR